MSNLDSQDIDDLPFIEALLKTGERKWGGILRVMKEGEQIGSVFMRDGQVAWAVSNNQTENFGSFLERIGLIPKEKLSEIAVKYRALGKSKKLGTLLEEEGLISRIKLRECLRAHIRAAISSMMNDPEVVIKASHGEMIVDANLMFLLNEVLPGHYTAGEPAEARTPLQDDATMRLEAACQASALKVLEHLGTLPGYLFSLISGADGKLLALHKADDGLNVAEAAASAIEWSNSAAANAVKLSCGKPECLTLEHDGGLLLAQWTDGEMDFFVCGSFDRDGKLGVIKHKIAEIIPSIRQIISNGVGQSGEPRWQM